MVPTTDEGSSGQTSGSTGEPPGSTGVDPDDTTGEPDGTTGEPDGTTGDPDGTTSMDDTSGSGSSSTTDDPPQCGDGVVEGAEACDDAGESESCNADCTLASCGDGVVNTTAGETCDDGGESATCNADCSVAACGDGVVNAAAGEVCDDAGRSDTCNADCTSALCGDGIINAAAGEVCDDAGESATCDSDCTAVLCGDGLTNMSAGEDCDDAGESMTCDVDCTPATCGDGVVNAAAGEACDDTVASESCNADCTPALCGDGLVNGAAGEACDDGGESATCNDDCSLVVCGDGLVNMTAGEVCDEGGESATCDDDCTLVMCGDGLTNVTAGELCDDMGESAACDADCTPAQCGDSLVNLSAGESCDDGGQSAACDVDCTAAECGDGVFNALALEECDTAGPTDMCDGDCTLVLCGDGLTNVPAGEQCDDAGESAVCNANCTTSACGDGITNVTAGEICDDMGESMSCDVDCTDVACGDGVTNLSAGEDCDDTAMSANCDADCTDVVCGDGTINTIAGEECEGGDLMGQTCQALGFTDGTLACDASCTLDTSACNALPGTPALGLQLAPIKQFEFSWAAVPGADYYQLEERVAPGEPFAQLGPDLVGTAVAHSMPLHYRYEASYRLRACNMAGCVESAVVDVMGSMVDAVGYIKASNTDPNDSFGRAIALSEDGNTLAVHARLEDSGATGVNGDQLDNSVSNAGAVYVFSRDAAGIWTQQAYLKSPDPGSNDQLGHALALDADGDTLIVGTPNEDGGAAGINGDPFDNSASNSGAVYVFTRDGAGAWSQHAYIKASNADSSDSFGASVAVSDDGTTMAVSAPSEDGNSVGVGGNEFDNSASGTGAVYVFTRNGAGVWSQQAYIKASNPDMFDGFGHDVALSGDGNTLAASAASEDSAATGIGGDQGNAGSQSGAAYVFIRNGAGMWSQQAYVKASNTDDVDHFGWSVDLSTSGDTLAVGARREDGSTPGVNGNDSNGLIDSGAAYVFARDGVGIWSQQAYIKASFIVPNDYFGHDVALSGDGTTLAVSALLESSDADGINGVQNDISQDNAGAIYVYESDGAGTWSYRTYVKASNSGENDHFGHSIAIDSTAHTIAAGAHGEGSIAVGIDGDQADDSAAFTGAVYLF